MKHFTAQQLADRLNNNPDNTLLLDVREPWEFDICHIEGSTLIPLGSLTEKVENVKTDKEIVVICHHGIRSLRAAIFLEHYGCDNVTNLTGGIDAWAKDIDQNMSQY